MRFKYQRIATNLDAEKNFLQAAEQLTALQLAPPAHAASHLPSGTDALTTATGATITGTNAEGSADSLSRSDHNHALPNWGTRFEGSTINAPASGAMVANTVYFTAVKVLSNATLTGLQFFCLSATGTARVALYNSAGTRVADRTTNSAALGVALTQIAFTSTYAAAPGLYFAGIVFSGAPNVIQAAGSQAGTVAGPGSGATATSITPPTVPAQGIPVMGTY